MGSSLQKERKHRSRHHNNVTSPFDRQIWICPSRASLCIQHACTHGYLKLCFYRFEAVHSISVQWKSYVVNPSLNSIHIPAYCLRRLYLQSSSPKHTLPSQVSVCVPEIWSLFETRNWKFWAIKQLHTTKGVQMLEISSRGEKVSNHVAACFYCKD
jgi:hypothetical protein